MNYSWARGREGNKVREIFSHTYEPVSSEFGVTGHIVWPLLPGDWALMGKQFTYSRTAYEIVPLKEL